MMSPPRHRIPSLRPRPRPGWKSAFLAFAAFAVLAAAQTAPDEDIAALKKMSLDDLMNVTVTSADRRPEKLSSTASAIQVISNADLLRSGAVDLPEALRWADNLQVAQKNAHDWGISARGFNTDLANKMLVLVDGRSVYTPLFSGVFWDLQDYLLEDIDRIEVISGPGGSLWGANAVNGVINVITKDSRDTQGGLVDVGGGDQWNGAAAARYGGRLAPNVTYRVYGKYLSHADDPQDAGRNVTDAWEMGREGFRVDADASADTALTLQGEYYRGRQDSPTGGQSETSGDHVLTGATHTLGSGSHLEFTAYYDRTHLLNPIAASAFAPAGSITDDTDTLNFDFQQRAPDDARQQWVWGLGYRQIRDAVGNSPVLSLVPGTADLNLFSGFVQDEMPLIRDWFLTLGSKAEHNDYTGFEFEPNVRLRWNFAPSEVLWAAVSRAVRTPSRIDRGIEQPTVPITVLSGGANFRSESLLAYELGYRGELSAHLSAAVSTFYNQYDDVRSLGITPVKVLPLVFQNNLEGDTYGAELTLTDQVSADWQLRAGYDLLREHVRPKPGTTDLNHALNETADPENQIFLRSLVELEHGWQFDASWRWIDRLTINNGGKPAVVPGYDELDVRIAWAVTAHWELSLVGQNLLHARHVEYGPTPGSQVEIDRSLLGKVLWRF